MSERLFMGIRVFAINMRAYVISGDPGVSAVVPRHSPCTLLREACHLGREGGDAVLRHTSDSDRRDGPWWGWEGA